MYDYKTNVSGVNVISQAIAAGTIATLPAGTRRVDVYIYSTAAGTTLTMGGLAWCKLTNGQEFQATIWLKHASDIVITCSGTGNISLGWT